MSTRSRIALREIDGSEKSIYCHHDGYLEWNGEILYKEYSNHLKLRSLLNLGNISSLGYDPHTPACDDIMGNIENSIVIAYHRDRGETLCFGDNYGIQEFNYLFDMKEQTWYVAKEVYNIKTDELVLGKYERLELLLALIKPEKKWSKPNLRKSQND